MESYQDFKGQMQSTVPGKTFQAHDIVFSIGKMVVVLHGVLWSTKYPHVQRPHTSHDSLRWGPFFGGLAVRGLFGGGDQHLGGQISPVVGHGGGYVTRHLSLASRPQVLFLPGGVGLFCEPCGSGPSTPGSLPPKSRDGPARGPWSRWTGWRCGGSRRSSPAGDTPARPSASWRDWRRSPRPSASPARGPPSPPPPHVTCVARQGDALPGEAMGRPACPNWQPRSRETLKGPSGSMFHS